MGASSGSEVQAWQAAGYLQCYKNQRGVMITSKGNRVGCCEDLCLVGVYVSKEGSGDNWQRFLIYMSL